MTPQEIVQRRLSTQQLAHSSSAKPEEVVARLGAIQAQDHGSSKWAIGARLPSATEADIEAAIGRKAIVRSWPMRGTLHYMAAADVRWMLALLTPRILAGSLKRHEEIGLDAATFARSAKKFRKWLQGGAPMTRDALAAALDKDGISTEGPRGYHLFWRHAQEGLICFGPHEGKQPTFVLLDDWVPAAKALDQEEALERLALRYFTGHGPATLDDFVWWSGLKVADARAGLQAAASKLVEEKDGDHVYWRSEAQASAGPVPRAHLLPGYDEYLLGYRHRDTILDGAHAAKVVPGGNGIFLPMLLLQGRIAGTWKRTLRSRKAMVTAFPFAPLPKAARKDVEEAAQRYGRFIGLPVEVTVA